MGGVWLTKIQKTSRSGSAPVGVVDKTEGTLWACQPDPEATAHFPWSGAQSPAVECDPALCWSNSLDCGRLSHILSVQFLAEKPYCRDDLRLHPPLTFAKFTNKVQKQAALIPILLGKLDCPESTSHTPWLCLPLSLEVNSTANCNTQKIPPFAKSSLSYSSARKREHGFARAHRHWTKGGEHERRAQDLTTERVAGGVSKTPHQTPDPWPHFPRLQWFISYNITWNTRNYPIASQVWETTP